MDRRTPGPAYRPRITLTRTYGVYEVESEARPGVTYRTDAVLGACDCPAGRWGKPCKHTALAIRVWEMHRALRRAARQRAQAPRPAVTPLGRATATRATGLAALQEAYA